MRYETLLAIFGLGLALAISLGSTSPTPAGEFTVVQTPEKVTVNIDGQLFTEYLTLSKTKPILWPIIGPTGARMTRDYPMIPRVKGEKPDHPHQRSLWFTHGSVNGVDFWTEVGTRRGTIHHREFGEVRGGTDALVVTRNDWLTPEGAKVLEDERRVRLFVDGAARGIDFDITLLASAGEVVFGDTKEGSFGLRVPTALDVNSRRGGHIQNSRGQTDNDAWGKQAEWVDYFGPIDEKVVGIAVLNHPSSFRFPTYWHVRDYGLFAANPFGIHDFKGIEQPEGEYKLPAGESIRLRYRVLFHEGDPATAAIAEAFSRYSVEP